MQRFVLSLILLATLLLSSCARKTDVETLKAEVSTLKAELAESRQDVRTLTERFESVNKADEAKLAQLEHANSDLRNQVSKLALPTEFGDIRAKSVTVIGDDAKPRIVLSVNSRGGGELGIPATQQRDGNLKLSSAGLRLEQAANAVSLSLEKFSMAASGVEGFSVVTKQDGGAFLRLIRNGTPVIYPQ